MMQHSQTTDEIYTPPAPQPGALTVTGPVVVPFLQALITGALGGIFLGVVAVVLQSAGAAWANPWAAAGLGWAGVTLYSWIGYRGRWQWVIERLLGVDLDRDGYVGEPAPYAPAPDPVRVEIIRNRGDQVDYIDVPYYEQVKQLAPGLVQGHRTFSVDGVRPVLGRREFAEVRDVFISRGLARWKNTHSANQGVEITGPGKALLRRLAGDPGDEPSKPLPPPTKYYIGPGEDPDSN